MILDVLTRYHHHHHHAHCNVVETSRSLYLVDSESPGCGKRDNYSLSCFMLEDPFSFLVTEPQKNRITMNLYTCVSCTYRLLCVGAQERVILLYCIVEDTQLHLCRRCIHCYTETILQDINRWMLSTGTNGGRKGRPLSSNGTL